METITLQKYTSGDSPEEVELPGPWGDLDEIKSANMISGNFYWSRNTVRFFRSRTAPTVTAGRFVIDSIQFVGSNGVAHPREYKIRGVRNDATTFSVAVPDTDGELCESFDTVRKARNALKRAIRDAVPA